MNQDEILRVFRETNALLRGHFQLTSGKHSGHYFQCALFLQYPDHAERVCRELAEQFRAARPTVVVGLAIGGLVVAHEVARALGVRAVFTERVSGQMQLRRGFHIEPEDRVLIVEDVITTGESAKEVIRLVRAIGAPIVGMGAIVDRSGGRIDFGDVPQANLIQLVMEAFAPEQCPLCHEGWEITSPGSKHLFGVL